jgi:hypothetical protein
MAGLSHYTTSKASTQKYEPVFLNQFEVIITPPAAIPVPAGVPGNGNILLEQVMSVNGLAPDITPAETFQRFKNAKRYYAGAAPTTTTFDLGIKFEVNLDNNNSMYVYKVLRQWADLQYNPLTGAMGLKKDYTGTIVIRIFNKAGDVFRQITCKDCFLLGDGINEMQLNYGSSEIYRIDMRWAVDVWDDIWI